MSKNSARFSLMSYPKSTGLVISDVYMIYIKWLRE